jgi:tetratricopeptide (TPR) repeat protein
MAFAELILRARTADVDTLRSLIGSARLDVVSPKIGGQTIFADAVARTRDTARAAQLYANLLPWAARCPAFLSAEGSTAHALGQLATVLGRTDDAQRHFEEAVAMNERIGARPWLAQSAAALADLLERADATAHADRVRALRQKALSIAVELEMTGLIAALRTLPTPTGPPSVPTPAAIDLESLLRRDGDVWAVSFDGSSFRLENSRGLEMLARLLAEPGREIHVLDLSGTTDPEALAAASSHAGPLLDAQAKQAYRQRLEGLREDLAEAEEWKDAARAARCREEIDALAEELARGVGLGGRDREAAKTTERARINVQRRLAHALKRIGEHHPRLAEILSRSLRTGTYCSYLGPV